MSDMQTRSSFVFPAFLVALGLAAAGFFIGFAIYQQQQSTRYVTVKGLAEREVKSDMALWVLRFSATGQNLAEVNKKIDKDQVAVRAFLMARGFTEAEIEQGPLKTTDLLAREYRAEGSDQNRYIIENSVVLRTGKLEVAQKAAGEVGTLVQSDVVLMDNRGPIYRFTKLNEIKPEMIAEATRNARSAAEQFAQDSGSAVGTIRNASQGVISLSERDADLLTAAEYGTGPTDSTILKKLRVVATVDYYLK